MHGSIWITEEHGSAILDGVYAIPGNFVYFAVVLRVPVRHRAILHRPHRVASLRTVCATSLPLHTAHKRRNGAKSANGAGGAT